MDSDGELDIVEQAERTALEGDEDGSDGEVVEVQREANEDEVEEVEADGNEDEETTRQVIKPKRVVRNPKPKLNADTLRGPRGLTALAPLFAKQKFKGKGHEEADLSKVLKTYEYWCHRLYPKMRFDQCVEKIETLGSKKPVMTYVKRIRMGLLDEQPPEPRENLDGDEDADNRPTQAEREQIESVEARFDSFAQREKAPEPQAQLTDEQKEIIRANRERAMRLRAERLRRIQEQAEAKLGASGTLPSRDERTSSARSQNVDESINVTTIEREIHEKSTQKVRESVLESQSQLTSVTQETSNVFEDDEDFDTLTSQIPTEVTDSSNDKGENRDEIPVDDFLQNLKSNKDLQGAPEESDAMEVDGNEKEAENEEEIDVDEMLNDLNEGAR